MRILLPVALAFLTAGCLAPGVRDPTRYPWDQPQPKGTYCILSLEVPSASGITVGGQAAHMACKLQPPPAPTPGERDLLR